jgi:periplasmic protein TonB
VAIGENAPRFASDGGALVLTAATVAVFLVYVHGRLQVMPPAQRNASFELSMQMEQPAAPVPPVPPPPVPPRPKQRHLVQMLETPTEPLPVVEEPAPADPAAALMSEPAPASAPATASHPDLDARYAAELHANIDRRTVPPDSAQYRLHHPSGEVRVRFIVTRGGEPQGVALLQSSGSPLLDEAALNIVASGHYPSMPAGVFSGEAKHAFVVTIEFRSGLRAGR